MSWLTTLLGRTSAPKAKVPFFTSEPAPFELTPAMEARARRSDKRAAGAAAGRQFLTSHAGVRNVLRLGGPEAPEVLPGGRRRHKETSAVMAKRAKFEQQEAAFRAKHSERLAYEAAQPGGRVRRYHYE